MSVVLMIRFTTAMVVLHILQIGVVGRSYRWLFLHHGVRFLFFGSSYRRLDTGTLFSRKCGESWDNRERYRRLIVAYR